MSGRRRRLLLGHDAIEVRESDELDRTRAWGEFVTDPLMIRVTPGMPPRRLFHVIAHELVHVTCDLDGFSLDKDVEEQFACCLANRFSEALIRNRWLRDLLGG